ncbi:hypothetical protein [Amycolatopsis minnesotensis]|uniref:Secreted protein n=1 Tax=Amycolatopsis minnesotensis TaxID=337894 RepID=A0ABP5DAE3_9PSEU
MRLRSVAVAVVSACALAVGVPATASATEGEFTYWYNDEDGELRQGALVDPPSGYCLEIPEIADFSDAHAFRPHNRTRSSARMFREADCEGGAFYTLRSGGRAGDRLLLRSVVFG